MKNNKGITMIALIITIILLIILAGVGIGTGNDIIKKSEIENLKTNMLLIKVKGKQYVENSNFKLGTNPTEEEKANRIEEAKKELIGEQITESNISNDISKYENIINKEQEEFVYYYKLSTENLVDIGLINVKSDEKNGLYIVKYDIKNAIVEVYNTKGVEDEDKQYHSLNEVQNMNI